MARGYLCDMCKRGLLNMDHYILRVRQHPNIAAKTRIRKDLCSACLGDIQRYITNNNSKTNQ